LRVQANRGGISSAPLSSERYGALPTERLREPREHSQVSVKLNVGESAHAERREPVFVLEPTKLALDGGPANLRDERVAGPA